MPCWKSILGLEACMDFLTSLLNVLYVLDIQMILTLFMIGCITEPVAEKTLRRCAETVIPHI